MLVSCDIYYLYENLLFINIILIKILNTTKYGVTPRLSGASLLFNSGLTLR